MSSPSSDFRIGRLAIAQGFVTPAQMETALAEQAADAAAGRPPRPLGVILVARGFLADHQLTKLLADLEPPPGSADAQDALLGDRLVRQGHIAPRQLQECLDLQTTAPRDVSGRPPRLGEILVQKGYATPAAIREALTGQRKDILACPGCGKRYNVRNHDPAKIYRCPTCKAALAPSTDLGAVRVDASAVLEASSAGLITAGAAPSAIPSGVTTPPIPPPSATQITDTPSLAAAVKSNATDPPPATAPPRRREEKKLRRPRVIVIEKGMSSWGIGAAVLMVTALVAGAWILAERRTGQRNQAKMGDGLARQSEEQGEPGSPPFTGRTGDPSAEQEQFDPGPRRPPLGALPLEKGQSRLPLAANASPASPPSQTDLAPETDSTLPEEGSAPVVENSTDGNTLGPAPVQQPPDPAADSADQELREGRILRFQGPPNAEPEDLRKAADALVRRSAYPGISAGVEPRRRKPVIELNWNRGFTTEMRERITRLASWAAAQAECRPHRHLEPLEQDMYLPKNRAEFKWDPIKDGSIWFRCVNSSEGLTKHDKQAVRAKLLKNFPVFKLQKASELMPTTGGDYSFDVSKDGVAIKHVSDGESLGLILDGFAIEDVSASVSIEEPEENDATDSITCPVCRGRRTVPDETLFVGGFLGGRDPSIFHTIERGCARCGGKGQIITRRQKARVTARRVSIVLNGLSRDLFLTFQNPMPFHLTEEGQPPPPALPGKPASQPPKPAVPKQAAPQDPESECKKWLLLAKNHHKQGDFKEAEKFLKLIFEKCPSGKTADAARAWKKEEDQKLLEEVER